jgi:hypothetical protein
MIKSIYVFVLTPNVDVYVSVLCHNLKHENVKKIVLIKIDKYSANDDFKTSDIFRRVEDLSNDSSINLERRKIYIETCEKMRNSIEYKSIDYNHLNISFLELVKSFHKKSDINDVSGLPKNLAVEFFSLFLAQGIKNIYTFNLKTKPKLYHELSADEFIYSSFYDFDSVKTSIKSIFKLKPLFTVIFGVLFCFFATSISVALFNFNSDISNYINYFGSVLGIVGFLISIYEAAKNQSD